MCLYSIVLLYYCEFLFSNQNHDKTSSLTPAHLMDKTAPYYAAYVQKQQALLTEHLGKCGKKYSSRKELCNKKGHLPDTTHCHHNMKAVSVVRSTAPERNFMTRKVTYQIQHTGNHNMKAVPNSTGSSACASIIIRATSCGFLLEE